MNNSPQIGKRYRTKIRTKTRHEDIIVQVVNHEQLHADFYREGRWVCVNEVTGRKMYRTTKQLLRLT
jgi:hypothetical protein